MIVSPLSFSAFCLIGGRSEPSQRHAVAITKPRQPPGVVSIYPSQSDPSHLQSEPSNFQAASPNVWFHPQPVATTALHPTEPTTPNSPPYAAISNGHRSTNGHLVPSEQFDMHRHTHNRAQPKAAAPMQTTLSPKPERTSLREAKRDISSPSLSIPSKHVVS
jgi:hypothetical protein